jgi:hypothetical protein
LAVLAHLQPITVLGAERVGVVVHVEIHRDAHAVPASSGQVWSEVIGALAGGEAGLEVETFVVEAVLEQVYVQIVDGEPRAAAGASPQAANVALLVTIEEGENAVIRAATSVLVQPRAHTCREARQKRRTTRLPRRMIIVAGLVCGSRLEEANKYRAAAVPSERIPFPIRPGRP